MVYLFGPFELDEDDFSLTRDGQRLSLEPKALRVLLLMLQSDGKLLTKNALLEGVWKTTFVEESTLSRAVALVRKQLGDDPKRPVYIETVPTLGYRFIAPVRTGTAPGHNVVAETGEVIEPGEATESNEAIEPSEAIEPVSTPVANGITEVNRPRLRRVVLGVAAGVAAVGLVAIGALLFTHHAPRSLTGKNTIVLADFANSTGESVFNDTLRQGLIMQLEQSPVLSLVSDQRIHGALRMMSQSPDARLSGALGREVCQRIGGAALLDGSIATLGSQYVLTLRAVSCDTGEVLDTEQRQAAKREEVLQALTQMAATFRSRVGESLPSVQSHDIALVEATTPSLDALKAFSDGSRILSANGSAASIPVFERATQLDPQFALAHAMLGRAYADVGQENHSAESTALAYQFRERASERERFFITASYQMQVTGDLQKALETCDAWRQIYTYDFGGPYGFPAGVLLRVFGRYEEGAQRGRQMLDADRDFSIPYHLLFTNLFALERFDDARQLVEEATHRNLQIPFFWLDRYRLAFIENDMSAMRQLAEQAATRPGVEDLIAAQEAEVLAYSGHLAQARQRSQSAVDIARRSGRIEAAARLQASSALREAFFGDREAATSQAKAALQMSTGRDVMYGAAMALALANDSGQASAFADELEQRLPEDTSVRLHYLPAIRALVALNREEPQAAIDLLRANIPVELGTPQSAFGGYYGTLYPVYVRGLALLAANRGVDAAAEFNKIVEHPGLVVADPIAALARLQLARGYVLAGDTVRARTAYAGFNDLWAGADTKAPLWQQARSEYARLR